MQEENNSDAGAGSASQRAGASSTQLLTALFLVRVLLGELSTFRKFSLSEVNGRLSRILAILAKNREYFVPRESNL